MNTSILVVDDDDAHRGMLRMMLQAWGYSVDEAADGDLAVEAVRAKPYDVVLTDVRMGRMDGIHALRGGTVAGTHTVHFFGPDEELELTHRAASRQIFVNGALHIARLLPGRPKGVYDLQKILFGA